MRTLSRNFSCFALLIAFTLPSVSHAEPASEEGHALADPIRQLILARACDVPVEDTDKACAGDCDLKRSGGEVFRPVMPSWFDVFSLQWHVGATVFSPALELGGLLDKTENPSHWGAALSLLSGLPFQTIDDAEAEASPGAPVLPNPAMVRWIGRELIPSPDTPMCGATAQVLYDKGFKSMVRQLATIYAGLKKSGILARVPLAELDKNVSQYKGRFNTRCNALVMAEKNEDLRSSVRYGCQWWLRRHAGPSARATASAEAMAALLAEVLRRYDAPWFKSIEKRFPKAPVPTKTP